MMQAYTDRDRARAHEAGEDSRLPTQSRHYDRIRVGPSRDYQGEFTLYLDSPGNGSLRVGLDVGDLAELRSALPGRREATAEEARDFLVEFAAQVEANSESSGWQRRMDALETVIEMLRKA